MMRRTLAGLVWWLGGLTLLCTPAGAGQSVTAAWRAALAPETWYAEPQAGTLLVATRELRDPLFSHAVILLLGHGVAGSQGLIVNQRSRWQLSDLLTDLDDGVDEHPVFFGGPLGVHRVFLLLHAADSVPGTQQVGDEDMWFSESRAVLDKLLSGPAHTEDLRFYVGYASWTTGQLAMEIARGSWLLVRGDTGIVFDPAGGDLWERLIDALQPDGILVSRELPQPVR